MLMSNIESLENESTEYDKVLLLVIIDHHCGEVLLEHVFRHLAEVMCFPTVTDDHELFYVDRLASRIVTCFRYLIIRIKYRSIITLQSCVDQKQIYS